MYKYMARELMELEQDAQLILYREPDIPKEVARHEAPVDLDSLLEGLTLAKLQKIFQSVMKRSEDRIDPIRSRFGAIRKESVSLEQRIGSVMEYARTHRRFRFHEVLKRRTDRLDVVVTFLAVLELMKIGSVYLSQEAPFGDMYIEARDTEGAEEISLEGLEDFDEKK